MMRTREQELRAADQRAAIAAAVAKVLGWGAADVTRAAKRARQEALAGFRNGYDFGGWLAMGQARDGSTVLRLNSYTGREVDPRATGLEGASTLD